MKLALEKLDYLCSCGHVHMKSSWRPVVECPPIGVCTLCQCRGFTSMFRIARIADNMRWRFVSFSERMGIKI